MLIINVILFLCGGSILGIGIWAVAEKIYLTDIVGNTLYQSASYLMVVIGCFLILLAFFGCFSTILDQRILVLFFAIALGGLFVLLITAGICAAVFEDQIETGMKQRMSRSILEQYGYNTEFVQENLDVTKAWDLVQSKLKCCAVDDRGWGVYINSRWAFSRNSQFQKVYVPESCCVYVGNLRAYLNQYNCQSFAYGPPAYNGGADNNALHYQGCYNAVREIVMDQSAILIGVCFSFCVFLISGIIISLMFFAKLKSSGRAHMHN